MPTTTKSPMDAVTAALAAHPEATAADLATAAGVGRSTAGKCLAILEAAGQATRTTGGRDGARRLPDRWATMATPPADPAPAGKGDGDGSARLGKGELGALVRDYLAEHGTEDLGPTAVGKGLGRSQGAVSNALARLVAGGEALLVSEAPRRYRLIDR